MLGLVVVLRQLDLSVLQSVRRLLFRDRILLPVLRSGRLDDLRCLRVKKHTASAAILGAAAFLIADAIEARYWSWFSGAARFSPWFLNAGRAVLFSVLSVFV